MEPEIGPVMRAASEIQAASNLAAAKILSEGELLQIVNSSRTALGLPAWEYQEFEKALIIPARERAAEAAKAANAQAERALLAKTQEEQRIRIKLLEDQKRIIELETQVATLQRK